MKKLIIGATLAVASVGAFAFAPSIVNAATLHGNGAGTGVQAHVANNDGAGYGYGYESSLQTRAQAVNMTADQLQEALKTRTMDQIMADQGVSTETYQAQVREAATARWESRGLSDDEIATREAAQAERQADCDGTGTNAGTGGYGHRNQQ